MAKRIETKVSNKIIDDGEPDIILPSRQSSRKRKPYPDLFQRLGLAFMFGIVWYLAWAVMPTFGLIDDNGRGFSSFLIAVIAVIIGWVYLIRK
jgi:hypothetical protein